MHKDQRRSHRQGDMISRAIILQVKYLFSLFHPKNYCKLSPRVMYLAIYGSPEEYMPSGVYSINYSL